MLLRKHLVLKGLLEMYNLIHTFLTYSLWLAKYEKDF